MTNQTLFVGDGFIGHAGGSLPFKIECDAFTEEDWLTLARYLARHISFKFVHGVPRGGMQFATALTPHCDPRSDTILIADDVYTTGTSMTRFAAENGIEKYMGVTAFAWQVPIQPWIHSLFVFNPLAG